MVYLCIEKGNIFEQEIVEYVTQMNIEFKHISSENMLEDVLEISKNISKNANDQRGIFIDNNGIGPFMVAAKVKDIICAQLNDEQSALMTRDHNNTNVISIGSDLVGLGVMKSIINRFLTHDYAGGRHQVRVDMLNSMIEEM